MALYWMASAGTKAGPTISRGWAATLAAVGYVVMEFESWWFNEDDPETPWDENEVTWEPCEANPPPEEEWPYND